MQESCYQSPNLVLSLIESVGYPCAWDIFYFRSSYNWTLDLEKELIKLHSEGRPPADLSKFGRYEI